MNGMSRLGRRQDAFAPGKLWNRGGGPGVYSQRKTPGNVYNFGAVAPGGVEIGS